MCSSARLSEACTRQRPATERESEGLLPWGVPAPPPRGPSLDLHKHHRSCTARPVEHGPPGNKLGLAEEEEMNLFQYRTPILIKSEVSDPEKTKLAEMTF